MEVELIDTLASDERVLLMVRERFAADGGVVEIGRANVYTVRGDSIVEVWIFEANQYEVDELVGGMSEVSISQPARRARAVDTVVVG